MTNQLDKWNRKYGKNEADEEAIRRTEVQKTEVEKGATIMKKATNNPTIKSEDIFAVIARDAMEPFIKLWTNSAQNTMNSVVSELRSEIKGIVREVIQEELQAAVRGVMKGVNEAVMPIIETRMGLTVSSTIPEANTDAEIKIENTVEEKLESHKEKKTRKEYRRGSSLGWSNMDIEQAKNRIFSLMDEAINEHGIELTSGKTFKALKGKYNTAYQKAIPIIFGVVEEGETGRGRWEQLVGMYNNR